MDKRTLEIVNKAFTETFGGEPTHYVAAPGRVNIIGEHVDYNDGFVLPMAIDYYAVIGARIIEGTTAKIHTTFNGDLAEFDVSEQPPKGNRAWANYIKGAIAYTMEKGIKPPAFEAVLCSTVPVGGGLSSSAAIEVAASTLCEALTGQHLDPSEKALVCQKAEHNYAGVPCGIMDQFISACGKKDHLLLLDCRDNSTKYVPMTDESVSILIINSNVSHSLDDGGYEKRRQQCDDAKAVLDLKSWRDASKSHLANLEGDELKRARHIIGELKRTPECADAIAAGNWEEAGKHMYASHASLRDDFEVSCEELDVIVAIAKSIGIEGGVYGCRMTGGGFGGCAVCLLETEKVEAVSEIIRKEYTAKTQQNASLFVSRPAQGAHILQI